MTGRISIETANFVLSSNTSNSAYDPAPFKYTASSETRTSPSITRLKTSSSTGRNVDGNDVDNDGGDDGKMVMMVMTVVVII